MVRVRRLLPGEEAALFALFRDAVQTGARRFYDADQRAAWAGPPAPPASWAERLTSQITLVAESGADAGKPAGFMTLGRDGHLDLAYVAPEAMGTGVASALHDRVIHEAHELGLARLETEASHLARRFFLKQGWREIAEQKVERDGILLTNFRMEKSLGPRR